jgi:glycerophosphoryl diester phosphodiesterase
MMLAAVLVIAPRAAMAEAPPPPVFADFGRTAPDRVAYDQAIDRGADYLVAPVVPTKDGSLIVAPDPELSAFTDVARRPEFGDRRRGAAIDGAPVSGWFCEDFTLAELKSLVTGSPAKGGGRTAPPSLFSLQDVIDIARAGCVRQARVVGVSPRLVRPTYYAAQELNLEPRLADIARLGGYDSSAAAMIAQAWEPTSLKTLAGLSRIRRVQLVDAEGGPADPTAMRYAAMIEPDGLKAVSGWAHAIAPVEPLLIQPAARGAIQPTGLGAAAHGAGLLVYARANPPVARARLTALFLAGADGVMCADAGLAARARGEAMERSRPVG